MLAQFRDLFNGLAPRQRITLVAVPLFVLAGLGLLVSHNSGLVEEPLLSGKAFNADELEQARLTLHKSGLSQFRVVEQRIIVPRDEVAHYNAALIEQSGMPAQFGKIWEQALDKKSLLPESDRELQERLDLARAKNVVVMICKNPQIADARIVWSNSRAHGTFGKVRRTAILSVTPHDGVELPRNLYQSLQRIVASAWNLAEQDVTIFNTKSGQSFKDLASVNPTVDAPSFPQNSAPSAPQSLEVAQTGASSVSKNRRPRASNDDSTKSRGTPARLLAGDALRQWGGTAALALFALVILHRTRRRTPLKVEISDRIEAPRAADASPESAPPVPAERPLQRKTPQIAVTSPGNPVEKQRHAPTDDGKSARDRLEPLSDQEPSSPNLDVQPSSATVPFRFLHEADPDFVLSFVTDEHPQTIALILSQLPASLAAKVLSGLPSTQRLEVGRRVANLEETSPEVVHDVAKSLKNRISSNFIGPFGRNGGVPAAQRINQTDRVSKLARLDSLELEDSALADRIRRMKFVFDDLLKLNGSTVASLFARIDSSKWALALKGASEELKSKILDNLSPLTADRLHNELEELGPVRLSDVAAAQQQIVALVRRLEDSGEIVVDTGADALRITA